MLFHHAAQHFTLAPEAFAFLHSETGVLQAPTDKTCGGEGCQRAARTGQSGHGVKQRRRPHIGIFCRRETVEEPGVDLLVQGFIQLTGEVVNIAEPQIQRNPTFIQQQSMTTC